MCVGITNDEIEDRSIEQPQHFDLGLRRGGSQEFKALVISNLPELSVQTLDCARQHSRVSIGEMARGDRHDTLVCVERVCSGLRGLQLARMMTLAMIRRELATRCCNSWS